MLNIERNKRVAKALDNTAMVGRSAQASIADLLVTIVDEFGIDAIRATKGRKSSTGISLSGEINRQVVDSLGKRGYHIQRTYVSRIFNEIIAEQFTQKSDATGEYLEYCEKKAKQVVVDISKGKVRLKQSDQRKAAGSKRKTTAVDLLELYKKLSPAEQEKFDKAHALL
jgi:hypothetical protein